MRCKDSPINSAIGGAATGALLFASHGAAPPRGAVICGALGAAGHWATDKANLEVNFRRLLIAWGLLDPSAAPKSEHPGIQVSVAPKVTSIEGNKNKENNTIGGKVSSMWQQLRPYFPIRKLTDEEWEQHQEKQNAVEEQARRAALEGVHPSVLDAKKE